MRDCQVPSAEHPRGAGVLQLVGRLRHGLSGLGHQHLRHHIPKRLHLVKQPDVHVRLTIPNSVNLTRGGLTLACKHRIKSNGGSGTVSNVVLENFIGHGNAYSLDIDQYWASMSAVAGDGVQLDNIKISNWTGTEADGSERGPIKVICADGAPCTEVDISDFDMWTESGDSQFYECQSAYTNLHRSPALYCMNGGTDYVSYSAVTKTVTAAPTGYAAPTMAADLATPTWGTTAEIPIPTIPASFFPDTTPIKALAGS